MKYDKYIIYTNVLVDDQLFFSIVDSGNSHDDFDLELLIMMNLCVQAVDIFVSFMNYKC